MSPSELLERLVACRPRWRRSALDLPYVHIAGMGHDVMRAIGAGCRDAWLRDVFSVVEDALVTGDAETKNLVVVGMFEAMQGDAYHRLDPPDRTDDWLGPLSLAAWRDLIEGWIGPGIRTIEHWKRVIVNGPIDAVRRETSASRWEEVRVGGELHWPGGWRGLSTEERDRVLSAFRPLVARALVAPGVLEDPEVLRVVQGTRTVRLAWSGDLGTDGTRWFRFDGADLLGRWPSRTG